MILVNDMLLSYAVVTKFSEKNDLALVEPRPSLHFESTMKVFTER